MFFFKRNVFTKSLARPCTWFLSLQKMNQSNLNFPHPPTFLYQSGGSCGTKLMQNQREGCQGCLIIAALSRNKSLPLHCWNCGVTETLSYLCLDLNVAARDEESVSCPSFGEGLIRSAWLEVKAMFQWSCLMSINFVAHKLSNCATTQIFV